MGQTINSKLRAPALATSIVGIGESILCTKKVKPLNEL